MATYVHSCPKHGSFERVASMAEASPYAPCPKKRCGKPSARDYKAEHPTSVVGMIDGEQVGYFPPQAGPYAEPGKSLKRVLKNNDAWREMVKRSEGKIGDIS